MKLNSSRTSITDAIIGTWSLQSFTEYTETSGLIQPLGSNPKGLLIYTAEGIVSAQLMRSGREELSAGAWEKASSAQLAELAEGYIAYCGTFLVDEESRQVIHTPIVALVPNLLNHAQLRTYELDGQQLTLETERPGPEGVPIMTTLVWRSYNADESSDVLPLQSSNS
jgi:hypothetical protein